jgi:hypothetical protein
MYLVIVAVLAAVFSTVGLAFFGITLISAALIGALIGIFIPAILVLVGLIILFMYRGQPRIGIGAALFCFVVAWVIAMLPGGGL